ncbi:MAG: amidohydrolase [Clostridiales bacterium]|nr:amidohydrolase [Clostridiales bacterium]
MQKVDLILQNATIITGDKSKSIMKNSALAVNQGVIIALGDSQELMSAYMADDIINGEGKYVFSGLINTHSHLFQVLTKGLGKDRLLWDWLNTSVLKMIPFMEPEMVYYAALGGLMENIRSGCTTTLDFNYAHGKPGVFEAVWQAYEDLGIRGYVGRPHHFNDYKGLGTEELESTEEFHAALHKLAERARDKEMLNLAIVCAGIPGLLDQYYYTPDYLHKIRETAEELQIPYTMHMAETLDDDNYLMPITGLRSITFLEQSDFLGERLVAAHCIQMEKQDIDSFARHRVKVSHNPVSNMILASGVAPLKEFREAGIDISLGNDGAGSNDSNDMIETMKFANLLQKVHSRDPLALSASDTLDMATNGGAAALCRRDIGNLAVGKKADFFVFNPMVLKSCPVAKPIEALIYTGSEANVETVVVNGKVILRQGCFTTVDEQEVLTKLSDYACQLRQNSGIVE